MPGSMNAHTQKSVIDIHRYNNYHIKTKGWVNMRTYDCTHVVRIWYIVQEVI